MRGDLITGLLLLLLLVGVQPGPAPQLQAWSRLKSFLPSLLGLGPVQEKVEQEAEDDSQDAPDQDYQVLQSFQVKKIDLNFS